MTATEIREAEFVHYWSSASEDCGDDTPGDSWAKRDALDLPRPKDFAVPFSSVLKSAQQLSLFVDIDPDTIGGTPRISATRIPVHMVLNAIEEHGSIEGALTAYRSLTELQVRDALRFSIHVLESPLEYESPATYR